MPLAETNTRPASADPGTRTAFLVVNSASAPDGRLLAAVKYPGENLSPEDAIARASESGEPLPVTFQVPVCVCVLRVGPDFSLLNFKCLDEPHFRPREIVNQFWFGVTHYKARLVTFNGRGFDLPLLELAAFRYGIQARDYYLARDRYRGPIDLTDWFTNFGACRLPGDLDVLAKLLGKPGKSVEQVPTGGSIQEINDRCLCDTLDTYFVFLRTRVLTGDLSSEQETELVVNAKSLLREKAAESTVLGRYLDNWTEFASV
ncbi:polysaccharide biosynthesis protein : Uncharacterized protein OS=Planctomyces maris DSM 8797 GN=PM8797T_07794 PE=4 SV=1: DNA_pol_B_exo2 [Gemmata massiliana]|uniref:Predicted 3'-5' exonuclease PolB-like domain-containing protein n=1 Tax=Gemmata massiliana TaxID=1210884 RepID=A0A6P2CUQ9_9BACT|nr:3'-5' exonuclease [Gemmata massiliana]VTR90920.1 polysaccharide biosynthesis protein : Uncharacterized protein OS=Planctomyces maris DSM 8797 GN=PM8797T_07794 PE=4 SV=1: DNA_pol_B_exo2 [Gemmata massiliana]